MSGPVDKLKKQSYKTTVDRLGYFCSICDTEVRNANGLVYFTSPEAVEAITVCHDCLPENFE